MANYLKAFPDFDDTLPEIEGFEDSSYRNDACPTMTNDELHLILFIDYKNPALSEMAFMNESSETMRFSLVQLDDENMFIPTSDGDTTLFESKELPEMLEFISNYRLKAASAPTP